MADARAIVVIVSTRLFRTGPCPFEDRLSDHLDVPVRPEQRSDRPGLVAEDAPLEPQITEQGAMEEAARA